MDQRLLFIKETYHLTDFQIKKYEVMFERLDSGDDNYLDFADFVPHVNHIKKEKNWEENGKFFLKMMNAKASFWMVLCYIEGTILENLIDKNQWIHFWAEMADSVCKGKTFHFGRHSMKIRPDKAPGWTTVIMHSLFEILDANFSGIISKAEYNLYLESIRIKLKAEELDKTWNILTDNKPKKGLKIDQMEELFTQWLINGDENNKVPGDYFPSGGYGI